MTNQLIYNIRILDIDFDIVVPHDDLLTINSFTQSQSHLHIIRIFNSQNILFLQTYHLQNSFSILSIIKKLWHNILPE